MMPLFSQVISFICLIANAASTNNVPVIGVLTLPCNEDTQNCEMENITYNATTYLPASYVKWIEGGGAEVIPLLSDMDQAQMRNIVSQINGILFTGGDASFTVQHYYWEQTLNILSYIREYHSQHKREGYAIPVYGTCLGFQAIVCETAKAGVDILNPNITANYVALPLNFTSNAKNSKMFNSTMDSSYSNDVYIALEENSITFNEHFHGFTPDVFTTDPYVQGNFSVLSTSIDIYNVEFVSLVETRSDLGLYWYGAQFHSEKPSYEFAKNIPKSLNATYANQYFSEFFVNECRLRNNNRMGTKLYNELNIYNFDPYYTGVQSDNEYQQMYLFPASE